MTSTERKTAMVIAAKRNRRMRDMPQEHRKPITAYDHMGFPIEVMPQEQKPRPVGTEVYGELGTAALQLDGHAFQAALVRLRALQPASDLHQAKLLRFLKKQGVIS